MAIVGTQILSDLILKVSADQCEDKVMKKVDIPCFCYLPDIEKTFSMEKVVYVARTSLDSNVEVIPLKEKRSIRD
ncbi:conserved hypothetical protein [Ricinus communis]|uniref:Uncharacterized protein n=1 Tax=Ricinus communis TaxID=3988 RepID=B9SSQ6_RICCO|nr:conserved hypothetical protein [Ricinus communis]